MTIRYALPFALALALAACTDTTDPHDGDEGELITTVRLTFTPQGGGDALVFTFADADSGADPVIDDIALSDDDDYDLTVEFLDELQDPAEDITEEIADEADEHQVFFTGTAVQGPATGTNASAVVTHAYDDEDAGGLPIGLANTITTTAVGSGTFIVTLRHLPAESGTAVKVDDLAATVATDGIGALPGDTDVQVTFDLVVGP